MGQWTTIEEEQEAYFVIKTISNKCI